jgi:hypothetical protein
MSTFSNLPKKPVTDSLQKVVKYFDTYYKTPVDITIENIDLLTGFFESRGFDRTSSENIAYVILKTAKQSDYKPEEIIEALKNYDNVQLNDFLISILNFNRIKTSSLGTIEKTTPTEDIKRNIRV